MKFAVPLTAAAFALAVSAIVVGWPAIPLGLPGEWVWNRTAKWPPIERFVLPAVAILGYALLVCVACQWAGRGGRSAAWVGLGSLVVGGWFAQAACLDLPLSPGGVERWPYSTASTATAGYFSVARKVELGKFLADYERWIAQADSFHIGTHPPGLFVLHSLLLDYFRAHPTQADRLLALLPSRFAAGLLDAKKLGRLEGGADYSISELATIAVADYMTWFVGLATMAPIYWLARQWSGPAASLFVAGLWPLVPAWSMFLPTSDCLYPAIAATAVALALAATQKDSTALAALAGVAWSFGMFLSLAFLAVTPLLGGLALAGAWRVETDRRLAGQRFCAFAFALACGGMILPLSFRLAFGTNIFAVWAINLSKHAGFYLAMPRSYWAWAAINLVEYAIVLGPAVSATATCAVLGLFANSRNGNALGPPGRPRSMATGKWAVVLWAATIIALDLSGRNRSEAARLWIFTIPMGCAATSWAVATESRAGWWTMFGLVVAQGFALLVLTARVEPLLPFAL